MFFDAGATTADAGPTTPGPQGLTAPATDADTNGNPDIEDALQTATIGTTTNF